MDIEARIIELLRKRAPESSICPSDVARSFSDDVPGWRALMQPVRDVAAGLARAGRISITQGDRTLEPGDVDHGPIRLRRGSAFPGS